MQRAVKAKFIQNEDIKKILLETSHKRLICYNPEDGFWGNGNGCGGENLNNLGKILEQLRSEFREDTTIVLSN